MFLRAFCYFIVEAKTCRNYGKSKVVGIPVYATLNLGDNELVATIITAVSRRNEVTDIGKLKGENKVWKFYIFCTYFLVVYKSETAVSMSNSLSDKNTARVPNLTIRLNFEKIYLVFLKNHEYTNLFLKPQYHKIFDVSKK